jgi:hypothetical protein
MYSPAVAAIAAMNRGPTGLHTKTGLNTEVPMYLLIDDSPRRHGNRVTAPHLTEQPIVRALVVLMVLTVSLALRAYAAAPAGPDHIPAPTAAALND